MGEILIAVKILFLSRWYPYPPNNGSKLRIYNLLRGLAEFHDVTLLSFSEQPDVDLRAPAVHALCCEVQVVPWKEFDPKSLRARLGFLSLTPRSALDTFSRAMAGHIQQILSSRVFDLVIASQWPMVSYARSWQGSAALFEEIEVGILYEQFAQTTSVWQRFRYGLTWAKHRAYLARVLRNFKACTVVSEREKQLLSRVVPGFEAIEVIPNCIDLVEYSDIHENPKSNCLIFTGSFRYFANHDAMTWFLQEIYPLVQAHVPNVHLVITGDHANLPLPPADNMTLTGFVDDVKPLIASAWVSLAPIRMGGGTRLKILEAMALGTPVVATSKGAEGLSVTSGEHLLIADSPEDFAESILRLMMDPGLRQRLSEAASQLVRERYDWAVISPLFLDLVERVACS